EAMRSHPLGRAAALIGAAMDRDPGRVVLETRLGTTRLLEMLSGDLLPRIC
ncbi:MAG: hydrogenase expression/formation protein HypE, partial [Deltaproteobacteria bacterium]|nr:hydrogenase expression/formation protein HypE [Deltaproteobacteria bacterium]